MPLPAKMRAIEISQPGGPEVLKLPERPVPQPEAPEILVKVAAAGVNRPDVLQRSGNYPVPPDASDLPGLEIAGEVVAKGSAVTLWKIGDRVCALAHGGGYAEYCTVPEVQALPVPKGLSLIEAASLPETCFTVWGNVYDRAKLAPGESLLVQGGTSGIGVTAIQMAAATGNRVFATAGSDEKCAACVRLGAEKAFNYRAQDFAAEDLAANRSRKDQAGDLQDLPARAGRRSAPADGELAAHRQAGAYCLAASAFSHSIKAATSGRPAASCAAMAK